MNKTPLGPQGVSELEMLTAEFTRRVEELIDRSGNGASQGYDVKPRCLGDVKGGSINLQEQNYAQSAFQPKAAPSSEVDRELATLSSNIDALSVAVEMVWERIRPVMHPPGPSGTSGTEMHVCGSAVGQQLQTLSSQVQNSTISLRNLLDLLAV